MLDKLINLTQRILPSWVAARFLQSVDRGGFKKYFKNTSWMFFSRIILMAINFFVAVYLARYLEPERFGTYNYVISFVGLFSFLVGLGVDAILGRELILHPEKKKVLLGSGFYINTFSALFALFIVNLGAFFLEKDPTMQLFIFIFSLSFLLQGFGIFATYFQSTVQAKQNARIQVSVAVLSALLKIVGFITSQGLLWFISLFVVDAIINALWSITIFKKQGETLDWTPNIAMIKKLIIYAFPFMLSIVAVSIYMKIDQVMIARMLGQKETGIYSVAVRLAEMWYFIPSLICASLAPSIVNAKKTSEGTYYTRMKSLLLFMLILGAILAIPLYLFSPYIIQHLYGPLYMGAIPPFQVYIWSSIPIFVMPALAVYITTENIGKKLLFSTVTGAIVNVILNVVLIPHYGILGSAIATFVSYTIPTIYLYTIFKKNEKKTYEHR
jgi:O-antigen/teichoic acid export membrane protein